MDDLTLIGKSKYMTNGNVKNPGDGQKILIN